MSPLLTRLKRRSIPAAFFLYLGPAVLAVDLKPEAIDGFNQLITTIEARLEPSFQGRQFLWFDQSPAIRQRLLDGAVIAQPVRGNGIIPLKGGLVQDWIGAVFIPRASLRDVLAVVQNYDRHKDIYKPDIARAKIESRQGDDYIVSMRVVKSKLLISAVFDTENVIRYVRLDARRVYSRSESKQINEVASAGQAGEHELPVGRDRGLLWRLYGYWFFEERDGGVYIACESVTMTRDMPFGMTAILSPIVHDFPGESVRKSLEQTRTAVAALRPR